MENKPKRGFIWDSKSIYADLYKNGLKQITFGLYYEDGSTKGEMCFRWNQTGAYLHSYSDSWEALSQFSDLFFHLVALGKHIEDEESIVAVLWSCGFEDLTKYA